MNTRIPCKAFPMTWSFLFEEFLFIVFSPSLWNAFWNRFVTSNLRNYSLPIIIIIIIFGKLKIHHPTLKSWNLRDIFWIQNDILKSSFLQLLFPWVYKYYILSIRLSLFLFCYISTAWNSFCFQRRCNVEFNVLIKDKGIWSEYFLINWIGLEFSSRAIL